MTESQSPQPDSKRWLIWLAIGVLVALIGPTWLYNWKFNPANQTPEPAAPVVEEPAEPSEPEE